MYGYPKILGNLRNLTLPNYTNYDLSNKIGHGYLRSFYNPQDPYNYNYTFGRMYDYLVKQQNDLINYLEEYHQLANYIWDNLSEFDSIVETRLTEMKKVFYLTVAFYYLFNLLEDVRITVLLSIIYYYLLFFSYLSN